MTDSRRPDDVRLSTADLAAAGEQARDQRKAEQQAQQNAAQRPAPSAPPSATRAHADRDVTPERHARADRPVNQPAKPEEDTIGSLFATTDSHELRERWQAIQTAFVDEPRQAVEHADALVATTIKRLAEMFAREREVLEQQWSRGGDVSTEDLRVALRRYRGFFDRLLSV